MLSYAARLEDGGWEAETDAARSANNDAILRLLTSFLFHHSHLVNLFHTFLCRSSRQATCALRCLHGSSASSYQRCSVRSASHRQAHINHLQGLDAGCTQLLRLSTLLRCNTGTSLLSLHSSHPHASVRLHRLLLSHLDARPGSGCRSNKQVTSILVLVPTRLQRTRQGRLLPLPTHAQAKAPTDPSERLCLGVR